MILYKLTNFSEKQFCDAFKKLSNVEILGKIQKLGEDVYTWYDNGMPKASPQLLDIKCAKTELMALLECELENRTRQTLDQRMHLSEHKRDNKQISARLALAAVPSEDYPPSNIASMIKQCEAKHRSDLGDKIKEQWIKVLNKYPGTRVNWGAASSISASSIKKNVFGGKDFVDWLSENAALTPAETQQAAKTPAVAVPANTPRIAIPEEGETPEQWKAEAKVTEGLLAQARAGFGSAKEFAEYIQKEIFNLHRMIADYGPGGAKSTTSKGKPSAMSLRVPKWLAQITAHETVLATIKQEIDDSEKQLLAAAESYGSVPITTVAYEKKAQESLEDVLGFILDIKDLKKQRELLLKFQDTLRAADKKTAANTAVAGPMDLLSEAWDAVVSFVTSIIKWGKSFSRATKRFGAIANGIVD